MGDGSIFRLLSWVKYTMTKLNDFFYILVVIDSTSLAGWISIEHVDEEL